MSEKKVTCKRCGEGGFFWRQSAKGKWYLCDSRSVLTSYGNSKWIPFAHKCTKDENGNIIKKKTQEEYKEEIIVEYTKKIKDYEKLESIGWVHDEEDIKEVAKMRDQLERWEKETK
jgi:hypothetical protein